MARYALIAPDDTIYTTKDESRIDLTAGVRDGYRWLPVVRSTVDNSTGPDTVSERADPVVEATQVSIVTTIRDMTQQEIDDRIDKEFDGQFQTDLKNWALEITNRVRVLEGGQPVTMAQLAAFIKGLR